MRAYKNLSGDQKRGISPIVELTRGRKNHKSVIEKTNEQYNFSSITNFLDEQLHDSQEFYIDITKERSLSSDRTEGLRDSTGGYSNWVSFIERLRQRKGQVIPVLQVNPLPEQSWTDYERSLRLQFDGLANSSHAIAYRATVKNDNSFDADLFALQERIRDFTAAGGIFRFFLDYDYIRPGTGELHAVEAAEILSVVHDITPWVSPVLIATSFPGSVTDVAGEESGEFSEEEVVFHRVASGLIHNKFANVIFGDYGSINPIRNDGIVMANGWRPRIDYPFGGERIFYYREKRESVGKGKNKEFVTSYSHHYRSVATSVVKDPRFVSDDASRDFTSWGVQQIRDAAQGNVNSSSPSFWISVRMNIHIQQQLRRLGHYVTPPSIFD